jgi:iron-sulfur cluster assembly protein
MSISITETAANEVKRVMQEQSMNDQEYSLKVGVAGGGCAGFTYDLGFEKTSDLNKTDYLVSDQFGVNVVVDNKSDLFLDGTIVDFYTGIDKRGFTFNNPQAKGGCCGCGNSFQA